MNHTDSNGAGEHRRHTEGRIDGRIDGRALAGIGTYQTSPARGRQDSGSLTMYGLIHEQLARQRHRELCLEARRSRLQRALRARRRAERAAEVAVRAAERAGWTFDATGRAPEASWTVSAK